MKKIKNLAVMFLTTTLVVAALTGCGSVEEKKEKAATSMAQQLKDEYAKNTGYDDYGTFAYLDDEIDEDNAKDYAQMQADGYVIKKLGKHTNWSYPHAAIFDSAKEAREWAAREFEREYNEPFKIYAEHGKYGEKRKNNIYVDDLEDTRFVRVQYDRLVIDIDCFSMFDDGSIDKDNFFEGFEKVDFSWIEDYYED